MLRSICQPMQPDRTALLIRLLRERILVMDGAMGTMIQQRKLSEADFRGCFHDHTHELTGRQRSAGAHASPRSCASIHDEYLAAGADIIETNTFSATAHRAGRLRHAGRGPRDQSSRRRASRARPPTRGPRARRTSRASSPARSGPTNRTASISPDVNDPGARNVTYDELVATYTEAVAGLAEGGADIILVETIFDTLNAKAALFAVESYFDQAGRRLPVIVSGTITDASGRTLSGQTPEAFWNAVRHVKPLAVGLNCALGAALMRPYIEEIARVADTFVSCYPNAGLPNPMAETGYDETPAQTSRAARRLRAAAASSTSSAAAAAPRPRTSGDRGRGGDAAAARDAAGAGRGGRRVTRRLVPQGRAETPFAMPS